MAAGIVYLVLMLSTRLQAETHRDEPNTESFSASLKEEIRKFLHEEIRQMQENLLQNLTEANVNGCTVLDEMDNKITAIKDDLRQELGSVQAAMETNIVRQLNATINEHNNHNEIGQKHHFIENNKERAKTLGDLIKIIDAYLRDIHPWVKSLLATSFTLPPFEDVEVSAAGELFVLHKDRERVSLYHPDAAAGFRLQWTRPAPAAPAGKSWNKIRAADDGRALLHASVTETVLLDADGTEVDRWPEDLILQAASSSRLMYWEGRPGDVQLHVYDVTDHSTRLFSLTPRDGGTWGQPRFDISPAGMFLVTDKDKKLLAAFSSTGERLYQVPTPYTPSQYAHALSSDDQRVFVRDDNRRDVHVHAAASGDHLTTLTATQLQLQDGEGVLGCVGQAGTDCVCLDL